MQKYRNRIAGLATFAGFVLFGAGLLTVSWTLTLAGLLLMLGAIFLLGARMYIWWVLMGMLVLGTMLWVYFPDILQAVSH